MPRPATGTIEHHDWKDGRTASWYLRVRFNGERCRVDLGTNHEGWNEERAQVELDRVNGQIERGTWEPPAPMVEPESAETLHVTASRLYRRKVAEGLGPKTEVDYEWRLSYLLKYQPHVVTESIDVRWVDDFREWLVGQESERGRPLSPRSVNMVLSILAMILDDAVEYELLSVNPARGPRRRLREPGKRRTFLEPDMVVDLLAAASDWEADLPANQRYGRRAVLAALCLGGFRISEAIEVPRSHLDVHAEILRVGKAKTAAGERDVELTAYLLGELRPHLAAVPGRLRREPTPATPVFPTRTGGRLNASNVRTRLLTETVKRANEKRGKQGKLLLPSRVTPHALRRTFASLALTAGRDVSWVMSQLGHKDARMTLEVYAQVLKRKRVDRQLVWKLMRFNGEDEEVAGVGEREKSRVA